MQASAFPHLEQSIQLVMGLTGFYQLCNYTLGYNCAFGHVLVHSAIFLYIRVGLYAVHTRATSMINIQGESCFTLIYHFRLK
jgi:hypothetical protein